MPVTGEYTWSESEDSLKISIPLKGVAALKVDILVSELTLKVNYTPYLIDIVLLKEVDSLKHKAVVKEGILIISLFKKVVEIWGEFERKADKATLKQIRTDSLKKRDQLEQELQVKKADRKVEEERHAVRKQMALDQAERGRLEDLKLEEKVTAEKQVYETFARMQAEEEKKKVVVAPAKTLIKPTQPTLTTASSPTTPPPPPQTTAVTTNIEKNEIFDEDYDMLSDVLEEDDDDDKVTKKIVEEREEEEEEAFEEDIKYIPPPRNVSLAGEEGGGTAEGKVKINFTPRVFPTPMRESKAAEEEDWIAKNRRHLKRHGVLGKGLQGKGKGVDISEEDPTWLKAKADDFFRSGDTKSALNAYSAAIDMDEKYLACYSNRAACYLKLNFFLPCKQDCDLAIKLCLEELAERQSSASPDVSELRKLLLSLLKLYLRRGSALCQLGQFQDSLNDYTTALNKFQLLDGPAIGQLSSSITGQSIQADIDRLKKLSQAENVKREADMLFADKALVQALDKYNIALQLLPVHVSALSNRAACHMALGKMEEAVRDCQLAIDLLLLSARPLHSQHQHQELLSNVQMKNMLNAILPPPESDKRKQWLLKTLLRKAVALTQLDRLPDAIKEYEIAARIDPKDEKIQADLISLRKLMEENESQGNEDVLPPALPTTSSTTST